MERSLMKRLIATTLILVGLMNGIFTNSVVIADEVKSEEDTTVMKEDIEKQLLNASDVSKLKPQEEDNEQYILIFNEIVDLYWKYFNQGKAAGVEDDTVPTSACEDTDADESNGEISIKDFEEQVIKIGYQYGQKNREVNTDDKAILEDDNKSEELKDGDCGDQRIISPTTKPFSLQESHGNVQPYRPFPRKIQDSTNSIPATVRTKTAINLFNGQVTNSSDSSSVVITLSPNQKKFVSKIARPAQLIASSNDLYASVMIAQAALESSWGTSDLSQSPNYNLFGIKGGFRGQSVQFNTREDNGLGVTRTILADFRSYPSYDESLMDYAKIMHQPLFLDVSKSKTNSYQDVTDYLQGRYATDSHYAAKLNQIIKTYDLEKYDHDVKPNDNHKTRDYHVSDTANYGRSTKKNVKKSDSKRSTQGFLFAKTGVSSMAIVICLFLKKLLVW